MPGNIVATLQEFHGFPRGGGSSGPLPAVSSLLVPGPISHLMTPLSFHLAGYEWGHSRADLPTYLPTTHPGVDPGTHRSLPRCVIYKAN